MFHTDEADASGVVSHKLLALFKRYADRKVHFIEPGGNYGDYLIYKGAYKLARLAGLQHQVLSFDAFQKKTFDLQDTVYIHGSGGFVPLWSGTPMKMLKKLSAEFQGTLILGPTTLSEDATYIHQVLHECLGNSHFRECYIFTRENVSFSILEKHLPCDAEIACDHDTALNLVRSDLLQRAAANGQYTLYAMRQDKERPASQGFNYYSWLDPVAASSSFNEWLLLHENASEIVTNRLHSAVVGSILGKATTILPNSYHKNRSVWEFSLRQRDVRWLDGIEVGPVISWVERSQALKKALTSERYQRLLKFRLAHLGF